MANGENNVIRSLIIPIKGGYLLLPNAIVAEVAPYTQPDLLGDSQPDWLLGVAKWRGQRIPVLELDALLAPANTEQVTAEQTKGKFRFVVLYGLESTQTLPFYAFVATDVPSMCNITEDAISAIKPTEKIPAISFTVTIPTTQQSAWMLDFAYLEGLLRKVAIK